ncbi:endonuclease-reverse transcriptase [Clonorchis sinensis]|uniref:Endonuclease-reverse transcriptase n=1 Tax=Clonorchis sinensis TaxID=79923 RepID=G7YD84_CLOSI|nr:endonuclease-reverse transcriptase [Clonorchis sinensis]
MESMDIRRSFCEDKIDAPLIPVVASRLGTSNNYWCIVVNLDDAAQKYPRETCKTQYRSHYLGMTGCECNKRRKRMSVVAILAKIIVYRLHAARAPKQKQKGFGSRRGCVDQLFTRIESRFKFEQLTKVCFLRSGAAFDSVQKGDLWTIHKKLVSGS